MLAGHRGLGVYILVLANAAYDARLWAQLAPALSARHAELAAAVTDALRSGRQLSEPDDDVLVFLKLHAIGFDQLQTLQSRCAGDWEVLFNPIRALRPPRMSGLKFDSLLRPFDPAGFHFNKAFLAREILWQGELAGKPARLLYNKFPFARLHGLLVPEPCARTPAISHAPNCTTGHGHSARKPTCPVSASATTARARAPRSTICTSRASCGRSRCRCRTRVLSTTAAPGPTRSPCQRFTDATTAWFQLDQLHQHNTPYNLIYSRGCLHLVARVPQDSDKLSAQSRSYGWSEMAGVVTLFSRETFDGLTCRSVRGRIGRIRAVVHRKALQCCQTIHRSWVACRPGTINYCVLCRCPGPALSGPQRLR